MFKRRFLVWSGHQAHLARNEHGFTLVEMMTALAIGGAMMAIAIPNYQKYSAKNRQTEARINLGAVYAAEKNFYVEWGTYTSCLASTGYKYDGGQRYYTVGFSNTGATRANCGSDGLTACNNFTISSTTVTCGTVDYGTNTNGTFVAATAKAFGTIPTAPAATGVTIAHFSVGAAGAISTSGTLDQWFINDANVIQNSTSGI